MSHYGKVDCILRRKRISKNRKKHDMMSIINCLIKAYPFSFIIWQSTEKGGGTKNDFELISKYFFFITYNLTSSTLQYQPTPLIFTHQQNTFKLFFFSWTNTFFVTTTIWDVVWNLTSELVTVTQTVTIIITKDMLKQDFNY